MYEIRIRGLCYTNIPVWPILKNSKCCGAMGNMPHVAAYGMLYKLVYLNYIIIRFSWKSI